MTFDGDNRSNAFGRFRKGMSIRSISVVVFAAAILTIAFSLFELSRSASNAQSLYELERERSRCDDAIQQFMDGSDYLTRQVQLYAIKSERSYMDSYWAEVHQTKSRDKALQVILKTDITEEERVAAVNGKAESDTLINGEIWAMRMVSESVGMAPGDMPSDVSAFELSEEDAALSPSEKQSRAIAYVFGPDYSMSKSVIRDHVNAFRAQIASRYAEKAMSALDRTRKTSIYMSIALVAFLLVFIAAVACFASQVVSPFVGFANSIAKHSEGLSVKLNENGALEIRQFARAFNTLSAQVGMNTKRLEKMGYVDYLTCVPNRASITEYVSNLIENKVQPLGLLIIDIDNFKKFNDEYGHALGDKVLKCVAQAVCSVQPADSGISGRLCGEEFVAAVRGADEASLLAVANGILCAVRLISAKDVNLPAEKDFKITVSAGGMIWHGESGANFERLLNLADKALYVSKETGKDKYTFYSGKPGLV